MSDSILHPHPLSHAHPSAHSEPAPAFQRERLTFAITQVLSASAACTKNGDAETVAVLAEYYRLAGDAAAAGGGSVVKVMGDGVIFSFPVDRCNEALGHLRRFQSDATKLWNDFDPRCRVQVKVGTGSVVRGKLGAPGHEHTDIYGDALNQLIRLPWGDFMLSAEVAAGAGRRRSNGKATPRSSARASGRVSKPK